MYFVHSSDGIKADSGISKQGGECWYPCKYQPPAHSYDYSCICTGFVRDGDDFKAVFELRKIDTEATEADKDAALCRFGVEV